MNPFGGHWKQRNKFQEYYLEIVKAIEDKDWMYIEQLRDELTLEQYLYIWRHIASYTRAKVPKGEECEIQHNGK